jgi:cytoskeletal protein CcmA (bactofilin family)
MTVFTRNDKAPEPIAGVKPATPVDPPKPAPIETRPVTPVTASSVSHTHSGAVSVISKALKITGQLESTEDIQIEGEVDGDVRAASVKVGPSAKVKGTVYGEQVEIAGSVEGKIEAKKVVLTRTAHMSGDVIHQDITIESGAYVNGHCRPEFGKSEGKVSKSFVPAAEKTNGAAAKPAVV